VLLAPSWSALQHLINLLYKFAGIIDMTCNATKTVCVVFHPVYKRKVLSDMCLPHFLLNGMHLRFVTKFKYLGHIINNKFTDDDDMKREMRNMFIR